MLLILLIASLQAVDISGTWIASFEAHDGPRTYTFEFVVSGEKLTGTIRFGKHESRIREGRIEDKALTFVEIERIDGRDVRVAYDGLVTSATEIHFSRTPEGLPAKEFVAARQSSGQRR
jgi:hypothetical protein